MREYFPVILVSSYEYFSFRNKLDQSSSTYNDHGNGSRVGRSGCSNQASSNEDSNSTVRK